jgi:hypothetical protein
MIGDDGDKEETDLDEVEDEALEDDSASEDEMPDIGGDTVIDVSGELEALVEKLDKDNPDEAAHRRAVRQRLEEIAEQRNKDLDSTFNFDLDEDV